MKIMRKIFKKIGKFFRWYLEQSGQIYLASIKYGYRVF